MASEANAECTEHEFRQARYKWEYHGRLQHNAEGVEYASSRLHDESEGAESDRRNI
jgi:hypothetical protein